MVAKSGKVWYRHHRVLSRRRTHTLCSNLWSYAFK